jgi:hypothetical protein
MMEVYCEGWEGMWEGCVRGALELRIRGTLGVEQRWSRGVLGA